LVKGCVLQAGISEPHPDVQVCGISVDADGKTVFGATKTKA
jgi:hypothetical protein